MPLIGNLKIFALGALSLKHMPYKLPHQTLLTLHTRPNLSAFKSTSFYPKQSPSTATAIPLLEHCFAYLKALIAFTCDFIYLLRMYFV